MSASCEIYYCHVEQDTERVSAGHWFFLTGRWAQCAQAYGSDDGGWTLFVDFEVAGKTLEHNELHFRSLKECKAFVASYFGGGVLDVDPADLPEPDL